MTISIFKGVTKSGEQSAFFDRPNADVMEHLFEMGDAAIEAAMAGNAADIDTGQPITRVAEVTVKAVEDPSLYDLTLKQSTEPMGKPTADRKPTAEAGTAVVQSLVFSKDSFSADEAKAWIGDHDGYGDYGMDETDDSYRFRQYDPQYFSKFRTGDLTDGVKAVYGIVKGETETSDGDAEKAAASACERDQVAVAIRDFNKSIDRNGLKLLHGSANVAKDENGNEERFVLSLVLEPNDGADGAPLKPDTQNDVYSKEAIRKTAHGWAENFGQIDLQHNWQALGKDDVAVLETYLAPCNFKCGDYDVVEGSWMLALRIKSDELWKGIQSGEIGAYSVGGTAIRTPVDEPAA
jgi:hypothetical protein